MEILPNWHPFFVHFTVALLSTAVVIYGVTLVWSSTELRTSLLTVARWNLWLGTLLSLLTVAAGIYAYKTVIHDTPSHEVMDEHRGLALITLLVFVLLSFGAWYRLRAKEGHPGVIFTVLALAALVLLMTTGWHGAELVYRHGLGVRSLPKPTHAAPSAIPADPHRQAEPHEHEHEHEHEHK